MKRLAIYTFVPSQNFQWDGNDLNKGTIGNSEIWVIKVAEEFAKREYDVTVFGNPKEGNVVVNNVTYLPITQFETVAKEKPFDSVIANRCVYELGDFIQNGTVVVKCQDAVIVGANTPEDLKLDKVYKFGVQSEYHKRMLMERYGLTEDVFYKSGFGFELIESDKELVRENKMVMHAAPGRQVRWFIEEILPKVRRQIPDFKLKVFGPLIDPNDTVYTAEGVEVMETPTKESIMAERLTSKIWAYPNHGYNSNFDIDDEVFPNEAMENAAAGCACVFGRWGSYASVFNGSNSFVGGNLYNDEKTPMDYDNMPAFADEMSAEIVKCLTDDFYLENNVNAIRKILDEYTWEHEADIMEEQIEAASKSIQVYIMAHKQVPYMAVDETHGVMQVGSKNDGSVVFSNLTDSTFRDNRADENGFLCELTGVYAVYKNLADKTDIVGQEHYRRHFKISDSRIRQVLADHDIILPTPLKLHETIAEQYRTCHIASDLDLCKQIIHDLYPQYDKAFIDFIENGHDLYYANSFICGNELYSKINAFAFNVIDEIINRVGCRTFDEWKKHAKKADMRMLPKDHENEGLENYEYQARVPAFLYERLLTLYVQAENLAIYHAEFSRLDDEWGKQNTKVMLVCIGRLENRYIREFVDFYRFIGVTNICLCDNNRTGEDDFRDVIGDYIDSGYVILKDYRDVTKPCQVEAYDACYKEYKDMYDWFMFFDIDEFIFLNTVKDIRTYLCSPMFEAYDMIHVNWLNFGDCGRVEAGDGTVMARFKEPLDINLATTYRFPDNYHIKSIVRGGLDRVEWVQQPHTPFIDGSCCNASGIKVDPTNLFLPYDYRCAGIRHYTTKSAEEFAVKLNRGFCDGNPSSKEKLLGLYFKRNKVTEEKVNLFKDRCGIDMSHLLPHEYNGPKRDDAQIYSLCYEKKNFNFIEDSVVTPLQVGAANGTDVCKLKDNDGENISDRNYFFVENTGTYWVWKNVKGLKYKGQMQYRRPLEGVNESMDFDDVFNKYDVITCEPFHHPDHKKPTQEEPMVIDADTVEQGLLILEMAVKTLYPEYRDSWDKYIKQGEDLYYSNGFVMKSDDYDRYSEFLFKCFEGFLSMSGIQGKESLVEHVRYNIEVGKYQRYPNPKQVPEEAVKWQTLIGGFLSERLWTLWLRHNFSDDRILKVPYVKMEPDKMYT